MVKFKYNIIKKNLSWENRNQRYVCDYINCKDEGKKAADRRGWKAEWVKKGRKEMVKILHI